VSVEPWNPDLSTLTQDVLAYARGREAALAAVTVGAPADVDPHALAGALRLGFVTELLSRPVQLGYLAGVASLILLAQGPRLVGLKLADGSLPHALATLARELAEGRWGAWPAALGLGTTAVLLLGRRVAPRIPWAFVCVVAGVAIVEAFGLAKAGATLPCRDATDEGLVRQDRAGTGRVIMSQDDVGGYRMQSGGGRRRTPSPACG
jgi:hypothetical protein